MVVALVVEPARPAQLLDQAQYQGAVTPTGQAVSAGQAGPSSNTTTLQPPSHSPIRAAPIARRIIIMFQPVLSIMFGLLAVFVTTLFRFL